jgi:hypothetical protein
MNQPIPMVPANILNEVARVCHEVNHAYCQSIGQASVPWRDAPEWQRASARSGVATVLKDPTISHGDLHRAWVEDKVRDGWTHGAVKDADAKTHPCMVPFEELPECERIKDALFLGVVRAMFSES